MRSTLPALGILLALVSACCAGRAGYITAPFRSTASEKALRLIRLLRDYTWSSRAIVEVLRSVVHGSGTVVENLEQERLQLANAIKRYLDGSERAEKDLRDGMLDFSPEEISASSARGWLWLSFATAVASALCQLAISLADVH